MLLRRFADLQRVSEEQGAYLSILQRRSPGRVLEVIQGIWIDEAAVLSLPSALVLPDAGGERALDLRYPGLALAPIYLDGDGAMRLPPHQSDPERVSS